MIYCDKSCVIPPKPVHQKKSQVQVVVEEEEGGESEFEYSNAENDDDDINVPTRFLKMVGRSFRDVSVEDEENASIVNGVRRLACVCVLNKFLESYSSIQLHSQQWRR